MKDKKNIENSSIAQSNIKNSNLIYGYDKFANKRGGHGFAAEKANNLYDNLTGKKAVIVGDNNAKNGADRIVNGIEIQSKYCKTGSKCIAECFDETGKMRYTTADGTKPMKIEVPSDLYHDAVQAMADRIRKGKVPGVTDPKEAVNIVRKGHFTYEQACRIAKAGTIESLAFDSVNGEIIALNSLGVSSLITFGLCIWNNEPLDVALKKSIISGLNVGGTAFLTSVIASQLARTTVNTSLKVGIETFLKSISPNISSELVSILCGSGSNISKVISNNILTGAVSFALCSSGDVIDLFKGRISEDQFAKNMAVSASGMAGMYLGYISAQALLSVFTLGAGSFILPFVTSLAIGSAMSEGAGGILNELLEDDSNEMLQIIQIVFQDLCRKYMLTSVEAERVIGKLQKIIDRDILKDMYESIDKKQFAFNLLYPLVRIEIRDRKKLRLPNRDYILNVLKYNIMSMNDFYSKIKTFKNKCVDSNTEKMCIAEPKKFRQLFGNVLLPKNLKNYIVLASLDKNTDELKRHSFVEVSL